MAKAFFRYLRGELNGFYIRNIYDTLNKTTEDIRQFFADFDSQQFDLDNMKAETVYNLGKFAGVSIKKTSQLDSSFSVHLSNTHTDDNGVEVSDRGLFQTEPETFDYIDSTVEGEINDLSTEKKRSSLVEDGAQRKYIASSNDDVIDENGLVKESALLDTPPENEAYSDFYGNNFMFLAEGIYTNKSLAVSSYIELVKAMQIIRYNGASVDSLCKIIDIVCTKELVQIVNITAVDESHVVVIYKYNENYDIDYKQQRMSLLHYLIKEKFPQVYLIEQGD